MHSSVGGASCRFIEWSHLTSVQFRFLTHTNIVSISHRVAWLHSPMYKLVGPKNYSFDHWNGSLTSFTCTSCEDSILFPVLTCTYSLPLFYIFSWALATGLWVMYLIWWNCSCKKRGVKFQHWHSGCRGNSTVCSEFHLELLVSFFLSLSHPALVWYSPETRLAWDPGLLCVCMLH
jgi:hypothetical protein